MKEGSEFGFLLRSASDAQVIINAAEHALGQVTHDQVAAALRMVRNSHRQHRESVLRLRHKLIEGAQFGAADVVEWDRCAALIASAYRALVAANEACASEGEGWKPQDED